MLICEPSELDYEYEINYECEFRISNHAVTFLEPSLYMLVFKENDFPAV